MKLVLKLSLLLALLFPLPASAAWPEKPVKLVVPYPPGGNVDNAARIVADGLEQLLGQPFVIDNRAGAGGLIAGEYVKKSRPDGYTIFVAANGPLLFSPLILDRGDAYNWKKDFQTIGSISFTPMVLQVHPSLEAKNLRELFALAAQMGDRLLMASPGAGTSNHLTSELLQSVVGVKWTTVQYRGNAPATTDLLGGQVHFNFDQISVALPYIQAGKLRPLAVTSAKRIPSLPDVPTFQEQGFADFEAVTFTGLFAPAQTPAEVKKTLSTALAEILGRPDVIKRFTVMGSEARAMSPDAFFDYVSKEDAKWTAVIKQANIKLE